MPGSDHKYWSVSISWHIWFYNSWIIMDRFKLKCQEEIAKLGCSQTSKIISKKRCEKVQVLKNDQKNMSLKSHIKLKGY